MNRKTFIETACIAGIRAQENVAQQKQHAQALHQTATAIADQLGLEAGVSPDASWEDNIAAAADAELARRATRIAELEKANAALEQQLEAATAPKGRSR